MNDLSSGWVSTLHDIATALYNTGKDELMSLVHAMFAEIEAPAPTE